MTIKQQINIFKKLKAKVEKNGYNIDLGSMPLEAVIEYKIYYKFIFDHDLQRALWGNDMLHKYKKEIKFNGGKMVVNMDDFLPAWQVYAKELAIQNDYLQYLKQFVL